MAQAGMAGHASGHFAWLSVGSAALARRAPHFVGLCQSNQGNEKATGLEDRALRYQPSFYPPAFRGGISPSSIKKVIDHGYRPSDLDTAYTLDTKLFFH